MKPQTIGRVLGIGLRVAGRMAGQRLAGTQVSESRPGAPGGRPARRPLTIEAARIPAAARNAGAVTGGLGRGFGAFLRPFRRVGSIVFLEIIGAFFLLFAGFFATWAWKLRDQWPGGPEHTKFLVYGAMMLLFLYLSVSSFWRSRRK
jgi:hypothetical protein